MRDPKLIFVGMASQSGEMKDQTEQGWRLFDKEIAGYRFIKRKVKCFSTAKARNIIVALAMQTDASRLIMVDYDMVFGEQHIERMLSHADAVVGALYPKKFFTLTPRWVCNFTGEKRTDGMAAALDVGAGFLCIRMEVFDRIVAVDEETDECGGELILAPAYLSEDEGARGENQFQFFAERIVNADWNGNGRWNRLLTEDFYFCWAAQQVGFKVWVDTVCQLGHVGEIDFLTLTAELQKLTQGEQPASAHQLPV